MYKFKFKDKFVLDLDAPAELVITEQLSAEELQRRIDDRYEKFRTYLDNRVRDYAGICAVFGINEENYLKKGFGNRSYYESMVDYKDAREKAESVKVIFDLSAIGKGEKGFDYLTEVLPQIDFGETMPNICLQFTGEEETINGRLPAILSAEEFEQIKQCEKILVANGVVDQLYVQEGEEGSQLTLKEVEEANKLVDVIANEVKSLNLSPFETVVYVHDKCSQFFYNWNDKLSGTNILPDIIKSGNIRCVGYATMFKAVIDELDIPELKVNLCSCFGVGKEGHALNTVSIKDDKYGIDGEYMQDVCFSALSQAKDKTDLAYCLFPVDDFIQMYSGDYRVVEDVNLKEYYDLEHKHPIGITRMSEEKAHEFLEESHKKFVDRLKRKGLPISIEKYAEAYFVGLIRSCVPEAEANRMVDEKMNHTIAVCSTVVGDDGASSAFFKKDIPEDFLEKHLCEYQFVDYELKRLKESSDDGLTEEEIEKKHEMIRTLVRRKEELLTPLEQGNAYNKNLIKSIIEKN